MSQRAFQDAYPDDLSHCFGCGKNNPQGHQLKSYWHQQEHESETTIAHFTPEPYHTAIPGFVYGGLLASLIDCHGTGSASAMAYKMDHRELGSVPALRFVTGALNVSFKAPTPMGVELRLVGRFSQVKERKIVVEIELSANGVLCVTGQVIAIKMPATMQS